MLSSSPLNSSSRSIPTVCSSPLSVGSSRCSSGLRASDHSTCDEVLSNHCDFLSRQESPVGGDDDEVSQRTGWEVFICKPWHGMGALHEGLGFGSRGVPSNSTF